MPRKAAAPKDLIYVAIASLVLSDLNPRKYISDEGIDRLADNIGAMKRLITPLTVRPQENGTYEVIAGERRTRALRRLVERGVFQESDTFPAVRVDVDDMQALEIALSENDNREDVHPMEQADGYLALNIRGLTPKEISVRSGKDLKLVVEMLKLASDIAPLTRKLFTDGIVNVDQALVLVQFSQGDQESYLTRHSREDYDPEQLLEVSDEEAEEIAAADGEIIEHYGSYFAVPEGVQPVVTYRLYDARTIYNELARTKVPVSKAKFDLDEYRQRGGLTTNPAGMFEGDPAFEADTFIESRELFNTMQREVMERLSQEAHASGLKAWVVDKAPVYNKIWKSHEGYVTFWLADNGEIMRRDNFGPTVIMTEEEQAEYVQEVTKKDAKNGGDSAPKINRKRLQLEDRAINQAVEHALFTDVRLQNVLTVLNYLGMSGLRLDVSANFMNPHEGYHAPEVVEVVETFYDRLRAAGVPLGDRHGSKEGEPLLHWDGYSSFKKAEDERIDYRAATRAILLEMTPEALEQVKRAFFVLSMTHVHDGTATEMHELVLDQTDADPTEYFTADEAYLKACKNAELGGIFADLNASGNFGTVKKDNVNFLLSNIKGRYSQWIPERLRAYVPETGAEVIPDQPPVVDGESAPAAAA